MKYLLILFLFTACQGASKPGIIDPNNIQNQGMVVYDRGHLTVVKITVDSVEYLVAYYGNISEGGVSIIKHEHI